MDSYECQCFDIQVQTPDPVGALKAKSDATVRIGRHSDAPEAARNIPGKVLLEKVLQHLHQ